MEKEKSRFIQPILDIPKVLKDFPKNLKKPKNAAELAQCKKVNKSYLWLIGFGLIITLIMMEIPFLEGIAALLGFVCVMALIFLLAHMNGVNNVAGAKIKKLSCAKCNEMITYDKNVQYEVKSTYWGVNATKTPTKKGEGADISPMNICVTGSHRAETVITFTCQKCGHTQSVEETFTIGECKKEQKNVEYIVADIVKLDLEKQVQKVCYAVFEQNKSSQNEFGVSVRRYDIASWVKDFFNV